MMINTKTMFSLIATSMVLSSVCAMDYRSGTISGLLPEDAQRYPHIKKQDEGSEKKPITKPQPAKEESGSDDPQTSSEAKEEEKSDPGSESTERNSEPSESPASEPDATPKDVASMPPPLADITQQTEEVIEPLTKDDDIKRDDFNIEVELTVKKKKLAGRGKNGEKDRILFIGTHKATEKRGVYYVEYKDNGAEFKKLKGEIDPVFTYFTKNANEIPNTFEFRNKKKSDLAKLMTNTRFSDKKTGFAVIEYYVGDDADDGTNSDDDQKSETGEKKVKSAWVIWITDDLATENQFKQAFEAMGANALPAGWGEAKDPKSGKTFYYHLSDPENTAKRVSEFPQHKVPEPAADQPLGSAKVNADGNDSNDNPPTVSHVELPPPRKDSDTAGDLKAVGDTISPTAEAPATAAAADNAEDKLELEAAGGCDRSSVDTATSSDVPVSRPPSTSSTLPGPEGDVTADGNTAGDVLEELTPPPFVDPDVGRPGTSTVPKADCRRRLLADLLKL